MAKVIGIDLGTTNSAMAYMEGGEPTIIPNAEGGRITPSVVAFTKTGERLVGQVAKRQAITNPENTIYSVKRLMGRRFTDSEVQRTVKMVPYKIQPASNGGVEIVLGNAQELTPPEVSAMILQKLKTDAEAYLGEKVTQAVITVPAYFDDQQRQATKDAGQIAGLEVLRIINEPTAASLAYGLDKKKDEIIAVYDLGGGTFDISVLQLGEGVFEVKATNGDTHLGGDDFDARVIDWLIDEFKKDQGIDLKNDRMALQRLKEAAEKAKIELSSTQQTEINLPFITADQAGPKHLVITLTRSKLEQLVGDLVEKTTAPVKQALKDAGVTPDKIDEVVLVGGQTRMPLVIETVKKLFNGKQPNQSVNPDEVVAIGAAIQAGVLKGEVKDVLLLNVTARDKATGREQHVTITASSGLSKDEVQRLVKDAEAHAEEDRRNREKIEARNQGDTMAYSIEKTLKDLGDKVPADTKKDVEEKLAALRDALKTDDVERIKSATEALRASSTKIGEVMYQQEQAKQQAEQSAQPGAEQAEGEPAGAGAKRDGDTIEGEFKEQS